MEDLLAWNLHTNDIWPLNNDVTWNTFVSSELIRDQQTSPFE